MKEAQYRDATALDAVSIAALHADSWSRYYRGAYPDAFLDGPVHADRLAVWTERLAQPQPRRCTIVADRDGEIVGFAHTVFAEDPVWGSLLDNLHVATAAHRQGIATVLMRLTAQRVAKAVPGAGLYLWVLEQNARAQAFYRAMGGTDVGHHVRPSAGGTTVGVLRYVWPDVNVLSAPRSKRS